MSENNGTPSDLTQIHSDVSPGFSAEVLAKEIDDRWPKADRGLWAELTDDQRHIRVDAVQQIPEHLTEIGVLS